MNAPARLMSAAALLAAVVLVGCQGGNPNAPARVTGKVTYNGAPLTGGSITFHFKEGGSASAAIAADGTYSAIDISAGEAVVTVETESVNPDKKKVEYRSTGGAGGGMYGKKSSGGGGASGGGKGAAMSPAPEGTPSSQTVYVKIPKRYSEVANSGLSATLKRGRQTHDVPLTD